MRIWFLIIIVAISSVVYSQKNNDPFVGGVEFGIGYGTVIDFNLDNNDNNEFELGFLLEKLQYLPTHIGFVSAKYLNPNEYFEFGILYTRKCSSYAYRYTYSTKYGTSSVSGGSALVLHCIDLPLKYYSYVGKMLKQQMYAYGGLIPSWIIEPVQYVGDFSIPEECYRNICVSVCGGLCYDKKKSRMKLHAGLAVTSVVNANYREIPEEDREYGGRIFPFELLFCYARMFR